MLWFALHLSGLPLEAWLASAPGEVSAIGHSAGDARPCCVVEDRRVVQADARAAAAGVEPGMSAATAASLLSGQAGLQVLPRDPARESAQVKRLAWSLVRFTPAVVLQRDGVLLEVAASLRLFGGVRSLWCAVRKTARASGVASLAMAAAPTATAASVLARVEPPSPVLRRLPVQQRLDALPLPRTLAAWGLEPRLGELLHGIGCRTLGDVRMLPRTGLQRRGAAALLDAIARAHGQAPDPQPWLEPPPTFEMGLELLHRADDAAMLVFAVQRLVQPLAGWLAQQWLAAAHLTLLLRHETSIRHAQPDTVVTLALGDPTREAAQLMLLLRERLVRTTLPAPVYALVLRLDQAVNHAGREKALWREQGAAANAQEAHALFDRLAARLGPEQVRKPVLVADHRPERALKWVPARDTSRDDQATPGAGRPAWLLPEPSRLAEEARSGRPLYHGVPLTLTSRAERIEAGWFDGQLVCRDYHVAQARDHRCLWVFRERRGGDAAHWYLQGIFG
jgi:protein ImuB